MADTFRRQLDTMGNADGVNEETVIERLALLPEELDDKIVVVKG